MDFNIRKILCETSTANIILGDEKLKAFSLRSGKRQVCPLATSTQHNTESPSQINRVRKKKIEGIQIEKEEVKRPLLRLWPISVGCGSNDSWIFWLLQSYYYYYLTVLFI